MFMCLYINFVFLVLVDYLFAFTSYYCPILLIRFFLCFLSFESVREKYLLQREKRREEATSIHKIFSARRAGKKIILLQRGRDFY